MVPIKSIADHADRFSKPVWDRPASSVSQASRIAPDEGELLDDGVSRQGRPRAGGRGRIDAARRDSDQELKTSPEQSDALRSSELSADPQLR